MIVFTSNLPKRYFKPKLEVPLASTENQKQIIGWRVEGGGWRVEGGGFTWDIGWRVEGKFLIMVTTC